MKRPHSFCHMLTALTRGGPVGFALKRADALDGGAAWLRYTVNR